MVKNPPTKEGDEEMWVCSLGQEDSLEKEKATHSRILAWEVPWMQEPDGLQSIGSQRAGDNLATKQQHKSGDRKQGGESFFRENKAWQQALRRGMWCSPGDEKQAR